MGFRYQGKHTNTVPVHMAQVVSCDVCTCTDHSLGNVEKAKVNQAVLLIKRYNWSDNTPINIQNIKNEKNRMFLFGKLVLWPIL